MLVQTFYGHRLWVEFLKSHNLFLESMIIKGVNVTEGMSFIDGVTAGTIFSSLLVLYVLQEASPPPDLNRVALFALSHIQG